MGRTAFPNRVFSMSMKHLSLSTKVTTAPCRSFLRSCPSPCPPTVCPLTCAGLSSIETRFGIGILVLEEELPSVLPPYLRCRRMLSLRMSSKTLLRMWGEYGEVAGRPGFTTPGFQRCQTAVIHSLYIGVAPFLPRNRAYTNTPIVLAMKLSEHFFLE